MDADRFDLLVRAVGASTSRRHGLKLLASTVLAALAGRVVGMRVTAAACDLEKCLFDAIDAYLFKIKECKDHGGSPAQSSSDGQLDCQRIPSITYFLAKRYCYARCSCPPKQCPPCQQPDPHDYCVCRPCPAETLCCKDKCYLPCPGEMSLNMATCTCECPPNAYPCPSGYPGQCFYVSCPPGKVPDPETCQCVCPPCPGGKAPNPTTCACECPKLTCPQAQSQDPDTCACRCTNTCSPGQMLDRDTCDCTCGGTSCAGTCCNGVCIDLQTDRANCGRCGTVCPGGRVCRNGTCACPADKPDLCNGVCTNFRYDSFACGDCGSPFVCPKEWICCPSESMVGVCTNPTYDGSNCGRCGNSCPGGKVCQDGKCACPPGTQDCGGQCKITCDADQQATCPPGGSCANYFSCSPEVPGCGCLTTTEGGGACVPGPRCKDVPPCLSSANCPPGFACVTNNCCDDTLPRCAPICSTQGPGVALTDGDMDDTLDTLAGRRFAATSGITPFPSGLEDQGFGR